MAHPTWANHDTGILAEGMDVRRALYGGLGGVCGATGGWLLWVTFQVLSQRPLSVLLAVAIGAGVTVLIHNVIEPYLKVVQEERNPGHAAPPAAGHTLRPTLLLLFFWIAALEALAGEVLQAVWQPFLISLATLFPAGVILKLAFPLPLGLPLPSVLFRSALVGAGVGLVTSLVRLPLDLRGLFPGLHWAGPVGWWALVGLGFGIAYAGGGAGRDRWIDWRPVLGCLFALALVILLCIPFVQRYVVRIPFYGMCFSVGAGALADEMFKAPDVPAFYWDESERKLHAEHAPNRPGGDAGKEGRAKSGWGSALARWLGYLRETNLQTAQDVWDHSSARHWQLCRELEQGWNSGLIRSWLVMLLFSLGLGLVSGVEWNYRPSSYAASRTRQYDQKFLGAMAVAVALAVAVLAVGWQPNPWVPLAPAGSGCRLEMPGTPRKLAFEWDIPTGAIEEDRPDNLRLLLQRKRPQLSGEKMKWEIYDVSLPSNDARFSFRYGDYGPTSFVFRDREVLLRSIEMEAALQLQLGKVEWLPNVKRTTVDGFPLRTFRFEVTSRDEVRVSYCTAHVVGTRLYLLTVTLPKNAPNAAVVERFFNSFALTQPGAR